MSDKLSSDETFAQVLEEWDEDFITQVLVDNPKLTHLLDEVFLK